MSNNTNRDFDSDLESILEEFSSYSDSLTGGRSAAPAAPSAPSGAPAEEAPPVPGRTEGDAQYYVDVSQLED